MHLMAFIAGEPKQLIRVPFSIELFSASLAVNHDSGFAIGNSAP